MNIQDAEKNIDKVKKYYLNELVKLRGSRTNPQLIEDIKVNVYNSLMQIKQLGTVNVVDPTLITIQCWDINNVGIIKEALQNSDLGVTPSNEGSIIKISLPPLTEERREELVKVVKKFSEEVKISVRRIRRDFIDDLEKESKSEDDIDRGKKEIQKLVDEFNKFIHDEVEKKEKDLMTL
jgi:ribosome recycling factor